MRFWGKIRGTQADYFIAEGTSDAAAANADGGEEDPAARGDVEPRNGHVERAAVMSWPLGGHIRSR